MNVRGSQQKKDLTRKLTQHTLGEVLHELGVDDIDDDYESSDEEKEDVVPIRVPTVHSRSTDAPAHFPSVPAYAMPTTTATQHQGGSFNKANQSNSRPVSRPNSFHRGSEHQNQSEVRHAKIGDVFDLKKLSEDEQLSLTLKLSEQESRYGVNMLDELRTMNPSEIKTLESFGYNFSQAVEIIFNQHHDVTPEVVHGVDDVSLLVEADGHRHHFEPQRVPQSSTIKRVPSGISAVAVHTPAVQEELKMYEQHNLLDHHNSSHGQTSSFMDSFQKPNALKTRRHSGIVNHIEEKLGHSLESHTENHGDELGHKAADTTSHTHSKTFMDNFHKPNALNDRRHSGVFHSQVELRQGIPALSLSRDNSLNAEVSFPTTTPRSTATTPSHKELAERRQSMRTPPPPDAIHHVNLLDRKQSGIRGHQIRQGSMSSEYQGSISDSFDGADVDKIHSAERRKSAGTPTPTDAVKNVKLLDRKGSGILYSRSRSNSLDASDQPQLVKPTPMKSGGSSANLVEEMLDPTQMSEEDQIKLTIKLSEQEAKYGTNMLEELKQINASEIETLESFGYNFGQAVEMIFKEHHDVTQEVVHNPDEAVLVLQEEHHHNSSKFTTATTNVAPESSNPLRRRPSQVDLLDAVKEAQVHESATRLTHKLSNPTMINPLRTDEHSDRRTSPMNYGSHAEKLNTVNYHQSHQDTQHRGQELHRVESNAMSENPLRRRPSNANLLQTEAHGALQSHPSNSNMLENPLRRRGSRTDLLEMAHQESQLSNNELARKSSSAKMFDSQTTGAMLENPLRKNSSKANLLDDMGSTGANLSSNGHYSAGNGDYSQSQYLHQSQQQQQQHHHHRVPSQSHMNFETQSVSSTQTLEAVRYASSHGHQQYTSHSGHYEQAYQDHHYQGQDPYYASQQLQQQQQQQEPHGGDMHRHNSHHQMLSQQPSHQTTGYPDEYYYQQQQQYAPVIDRRLSSSSHSQSYYEGDPRYGGVPVMSRSVSNQDDRSGVRGPSIVSDHSYGDNQYTDPYHQHQLQFQQQSPPTPQQQPQPKSISHRPSAHNIVPVRVDAYFEVPSSDYGTPSHAGPQGVYRSSSQEVNRSHSQSFYDQHRSPSQQYSSQTVSHQAISRSQSSNYQDHYSPQPSVYLPPQPIYDSFDRSPQYYQQPPQPPHYQQQQQQYSPQPPVAIRRTGSAAHGRGSLSQPPSNIIESMRAESLSRLSEDQQIQLSMLVSKQEEVHGMNMFDSLNSGDQPEIDYWLSLGFKFDKVALFMFQRRFDPMVTRPER